MLSLGTGDKETAVTRLPIVQKLKIPWNDYQARYGRVATRAAKIGGIGPTPLNPPINVPLARERFLGLIESSITMENAHFSETDQQLNMVIPLNELNAMFPQMDQVQQLQYVRSLFSGVEEDQSAEIEEFFTTTAQMPYLDKVTTERYARFFLEFLKLREVRSWAELNEGLLNDFEKWRKETAVSWKGRTGSAPSARVVNRNMQFLKKSLDEARDREYIKRNPLKNWRPKPHITPLQQSLTVKELHAVLSHEKWQQDFLMYGKKKIQLGFRLLDYLLLLFVSCKRRKEILKLGIPNINYAQNWVHYMEHKNSSKGTQYVVQKAFWMTPAMKQFLKRITRGRTEGPVFPRPEELRRNNPTDEAMNGDYLSQLFADVAAEVVPKKHVTLKNLRQTATSIMEDAGLTDDEQDAALGHIQIKTALPYYQDRSDEAIAKRISARTRKGIEVLSAAVEDFLTGKLP
ncbi:MAG: hypothetical protein GF410_09385 [Chitinivibrionales bacterium]|nr:hypothetical protein [Chitinivibrionales bacterium]